MKLTFGLLWIASLIPLYSCNASARPQPSANTIVQTAQGVHAEEMPRIPATVADWARGAMLFEGLGNVHRPITTASPTAQKYFDQGMALMWAFNHDEATRSFAKAAELDRKCAACFWGVSLTVGPNYNVPFLVEERARVAFEALAKARENAAHVSPIEQALITALASRYPTALPLDATKTLPILVAYATAMQAVVIHRARSIRAMGRVTDDACPQSKAHRANRGLSLRTRGCPCG